MIYVAGAGRTGTSFIARVLHERVGVDMGGPGRKHWTNPQGDYEDERIRAVNRRRFLGDTTPDEWREEFRAEVDNLIEPWGFKDPASCYFLDDILDVLGDDVSVIWARRDIDDTVESWMRCYKREPDTCRTEIQAREAAISLHLRGHKFLTVDTTHKWAPEAMERVLRRFVDVGGST